MRAACFDQIDGSRTDEDSVLSTHKQTKIKPIMANANTATSWSQTLKSSPQCRPDDWKTVSQKLREKRRDRVSISLIITPRTRNQNYP